MTSILPEWPAAWYLACTSRELGAVPRGFRAFGRDLVVYRTASGRVAVMLARCAHMGANLAGGSVVGECLRCPFHHWEFDAAGQCQRIPSTAEIPAFARQLAFPAVERHGGVFFFNAATPAYPLPFFDRCTPADLAAAPAFSLVLDCPWYMVGANGIDLQHFQATHDRALVGQPEVHHPAPHIHQSTTRFRIIGPNWRDCVMRRLAGAEVEMHVTDWAGTLFFVQATLARAQTFGMVAMLPLEADRTLLRVIISVRRRLVLWDAIHARIRRYFIRKFLEPDVARSAGTDFRPDRLIAADRHLADYFAWLHSLHGSHVVPSCERQDSRGP